MGGTDTTPPTAPTAFAKTGATATTHRDELDRLDRQRRRHRLPALPRRQPGRHDDRPRYTFTGLTCNTSYSLGVEAFDAAGNVSPRTPLTASSGACDTTAPTVSITAPPDGGTVSGIVNVTAAASDNSSVAGVQFKVDGAQPRQRGHQQPVLDRLGHRDGDARQHTLTAVARDPSGNTATSAPVDRHRAGAAGRQRPASPHTRSTTARARSRATRPATATGHDRRRDVDDRQVRLGAELRRHERPRRPARLGTLLQGRLHARGLGQEERRQEGRRGRRHLELPQGGPMLWIDDVAGRYRATLSTGVSNFLDSGQTPRGRHVAAHRRHLRRRDRALLRQRHAGGQQGVHRQRRRQRHAGGSAPTATRRAASSTA